MTLTRKWMTKKKWHFSKSGICKLLATIFRTTVFSAWGRLGRILIVRESQNQSSEVKSELCKLQAPLRACEAHLNTPPLAAALKIERLKRKEKESQTFLVSFFLAIWIDRSKSRMPWKLTLAMPICYGIKSCNSTWMNATIDVKYTQAHSWILIRFVT